MTKPAMQTEAASTFFQNAASLARTRRDSVGGRFKPVAVHFSVTIITTDNGLSIVGIGGWSTISSDGAGDSLLVDSRAGELISGAVLVSFTYRD